MSYHFVKVGQVNHSDKETTWYFVPESVEQIKEHWDKYVGAEIKNGTQEIINNISNIIKGRLSEHYRTTWGSLIEQVSGIKEKSYLETEFEEENMLWKNRIDWFNKYGEIYLTDGLTMFMLVEGFTEIKEHIYKDKLEFPTEKYTIDDVRYIQWDGGKHWYAKVGNIDIVWDGQQKWDTKLKAEIAVRQYFNYRYTTK